MPTPIKIEKLRELLDDGAQLVEVLPPEDYEDEHLSGAINLPLKELDAETAGRLDKSKPVIVYCYNNECDVSPRAACRLETLGFDQVYDYVPGKSDWIARELPTEGENSNKPRIGAYVHDDVVTCRLDDAVGPVRERVESSPFGFALVTTEDGLLYGRLRRKALEGDPDARAEDVMNPGPSTVRPDTKVAELVERLRDKDLKTSLVSTPEGRLLGVVRRSELESAIDG